MKEKLAALLRDPKFRVSLMALVILVLAKLGLDLSEGIQSAIDTALTVGFPLLAGWLMPTPGKELE